MTQAVNQFNEPMDTTIQYKAEACGLSRVYEDILEITRRNLLGSPKTRENAKDILAVWACNKQKPDISQHRPEYILLFLLMKEIRRRKRVRRV